MSKTADPAPRGYTASGPYRSGIVGMRYDATEFMQGMTEVLAYGTAVKLRPRV